MKAKSQHSARERVRSYTTTVAINGTRIKPRNALHRRKLLALQKYVKNLLAGPARAQIAKIILFGSVATGDVRKESDVDVLVFGFDNLESLQDASYDATLKLGDLGGEGVEPLFETIEEWFKPEDYFMYRVTRFGKEIFSVPDEILKREQVGSMVELARDYLSYAEYCQSGEKWRAVADLSYNAAELCVKGLVLLKMDDLPSSHGGLLTKFGEFFVNSGTFPRELGRRLRQGLQVRSWARYRRQVAITREMAEENLSLAREMISHLDTLLREQK